MNNQRTTDEQQVNTSKEDKEVKEDKEEIKISFVEFWDLYDKKVGDKEKLQKKWISLTDIEREQAMRHIPKYKISQPDKKFRKDPSTYLNNKSFNDEIISGDFTKNDEPKAEYHPPKQVVQKEYWEIKYGHLAKTKEEFMKLVAEGKIDD